MMRFIIYYSQGVLVNVTYLVNQSEVVRQEISMDILDNPKLGFYQLVYTLNLLAILIFTVVKSHTFVQVGVYLKAWPHTRENHTKLSI